MKRFSLRTARVLGLMSGTSADGIDVALVRIAENAPRLRARLENFCTVPFPAAVRETVLRAANGGPTTTSEVSQLNFLLGELFARAALEACHRFRVRPRQLALVGSHGQTVFHQGRPGKHKLGSTLQIGEPAIIAARTGITTVGDFRPADMAAGGQGAPLVPWVDYLLFRHAHRGRVALNIGGIANVTVIPRGARAEQVFAFDTGPGNMVIDALVRHFTLGRQSFDRNARMAAGGLLLPELLNELLADPYFRRPPPKTAGREQFGEVFAQKLIAEGRKRRTRPTDMVRTATVLTALTIVDAFHRWILSRAAMDEIIVSGGGARNPVLMTQLAAALQGIRLRISSEFGVPADAKEAFAFAVLAWETLHGRPGNLPRATGASRPAILGKVCYAPRK